MERPPETQKEGPPAAPPARRPSTSNIIMVLMLLGLLAVVFSSGFTGEQSKIGYSFFLKQIEEKNILRVDLGEFQAKGIFAKPPVKPNRINDKGEVVKPKKPIQLTHKFVVELSGSDRQRAELERLLKEEGVEYHWDRASQGTRLLYNMLMILLFLAPCGLILWFMFRRSRDQFMGGGGFLSGFNKSPAKEYDVNEQGTTFDDVAGLEGVKKDLLEVVEFLQDPEKFQRLGGRVPRGVLLLGSPGTGKTLLARAVAGEAKVPFFSVNGSEFIQMFVGVGASRVRDLFQQAKAAAPAIVFIDEIDAVGRQRGAGLGGGHDEREQTLNQILGEMDGFTQGATVIVIAATNRPDVLDPALLRPGRFDRHITVERPTKKGRKAIFQVHVRDVPLADDVDLDRLAAGTVGMTGADIRNLANEAALWAARNDKKQVDMDDFEYARDKVLMGPAREEVLMGKEKEKTAYHEAGHALVAWLSEGTDRIHKVTVIPRGRALGVTQTLPEEDKMNITESELHDRLAFFLGGREAETLIYEEASAGAENDLERATSMARRMVTQWGMSERLGPVCYKLADEDPFLGREMHEHRQFSEHTMQIIDEEVAKVLHNASEQAKQLLVDNRDKLEKITAALLEREEINESEITELIGPSVHVKPQSDADDQPSSSPVSAIAAKDGASKMDVK